MAEPTSTVIVVDDDPAIRESIGGLLRSVGLQAKLLTSVDEFLKAGRTEGPACLVLDVRLPGRSGLDFQRELAAANIPRIREKHAVSHSRNACSTVSVSQLEWNR